MLVEFDSIPEDAKVWIYPSSRKFYANEIEEVERKVKNFVETWKAENEDFKASYKILYNRFIILTADDITTTLTSKDIDTSVVFIIELQQTYNVALLDKMNVCFKQGKFVQYKELKDFKKLLKNKAVTAKTIVFDNLITTKQEFENHWEVAIENSWYSRFLK
ncbi:ABC transporter ATPase [Polaribacter cellanae]|uniref:ABC transporter ATPase n=1 Tax=Polaribacter cellanae TaxID=2818493 RepID=A0A975CLA1_9FLAO|nr:ABC transporter ATPase [Polaribacter cellanae]QTE21743.1 ABC transporter ATPase [Polaribacter cellanae]